MQAASAILQETDALEFGAGTGHYSKLLLEWGVDHIDAVDLSKSMIARLPTENITGIVGDAATIDIGRTFGFILAAGILEFVDSPLAVLQNANRHLATDGVMVTLLPKKNIWGEVYKRYHRRHGIEVRLFSQSDVENLAARLNWTIAESRFVWPFSSVYRFTKPRKPTA